MSTPVMIDVQGRRTRVRVKGDPSLEPVLLLHGIGRSLEDWDLQFARLSQTHRVIALDLPGSGFSERTPAPANLEDLAQGALATVEALGERRPLHVIGNSLGGAVAQQMVALDPARVASLVLVNSAGFGKEVALPIRLLAVPVLGRVMSHRASPSSVRMLERLNFADPALATPTRIEHALAIAAQPGTGDVVWETVQGLVSARFGIASGWRRSLLQEVAAADKPTLVVWGDKDRVLPHHHLDEARRSLPNASTHLFEGVGHMPQIETPDAFAYLVEEFLGTVRHGTAAPRSGRVARSRRAERSTA